MGKDITIDGRTYIGIESVSVNENIFGEGGSSDYTEEVLRRNFDPNGQLFVDNANINFPNGDYVEFQVDISNQPPGRIIAAIGTDITVWPSEHNNVYDIMIYKNYDDPTVLSISYMRGTSNSMYRSTNKLVPVSDGIFNIKFRAGEIWINDVLLKPSSFTSYNMGSAIESVRNALLDMTSLQIGAAQADNDYSYAHYDYIKVFRKI